MKYAEMEDGVVSEEDVCEYLSAVMRLNVIILRYFLYTTIQDNDSIRRGVFTEYENVIYSKLNC